MGGLSVWGWYHLAFFGLFIPWAATRSLRRLRQSGPPPRAAFFAGVIAQQLVFIVISLAVAWIEGLTLLPPAPPPLGALLLGLGLFLASWAGMRPQWRKAVEEDQIQVQLASPRTPRERRLWVGVSLAAGIGEELTYRGVIFLLLLRLTHDPLSAAVVSAAMFGAAHAVQGWQAVGITAVFALAAQALTAYSGSLYAAMLWHAGYDVVAGFGYGRHARERDDRTAAPHPAVPAPPDEGPLPGGESGPS